MSDIIAVRARALPARNGSSPRERAGLDGTAALEVSAESIVTIAARDRRQVITDLVALTKPRVVVMVLVTTLVGYYMGLTGPADWGRVLHLVFGTLLAAAGTLALNQYWERDVDSRMERTRGRPLPEGRLQPLEALAFGGAITLIGVAYLAAFVNAVVAGVTVTTVVLYLFAYTPLKLRTALCTVVGAVPGALPPVTGWVAARDELGLGAFLLFGILFLWQLPHTLAIARLYRDDYARAGVRVLPVVDGGGTSTERQIVTACLGLLVVSLLPTLVGLAGPIYFLGALLFGLGFSILGVLQALEPTARAARRVLLASLLYLPAILALLALDKA
jgi:protoheme IX farnesyltransferase